MIPLALRERVLVKLQRQRSLTSPTQLTELIDATADGRVHDRASLAAFVTAQGVVVSVDWIHRTLKHLEDIWSYNKSTQQLIPITPSDTAMVVEPLTPKTNASTTPTSTPPPVVVSSMRAMTAAMRNMWYNGETLPFSMPDQDPKFDRNDLYGTNEPCLRTLIYHSTLRLPEHAVRFVRLASTTHQMYEYVTWCESGEYETFAARVNREEVQCNAFVTQKVREGHVFNCYPVCDEVGFIHMHDLDDHLYLLEKYITAYNTRFMYSQYGLNMSEVPHLGHRSLLYMGGNRTMLEMYIKWSAAIKKTKEMVKWIMRNVEEAHAVQEACEKWTACGTDDELSKAFHAKWEGKCEKAIMELTRAETLHQYTSVLHGRLKNQVVQALVDAYVKYPYMTPLFLIHLRQALEVPAENVLKAARDEVTKLRNQRSMSTRYALLVLKMWDGKADIPSYTRQDVNIAFARIARSTHPDKTGGVVGQMPEQIQAARDCLHNSLESSD